MTKEKLDKLMQNEIYQKFGNKEHIGNNNIPVYTPEGLYNAAVYIIDNYTEDQATRLNLIEIAKLIGIGYDALNNYSKNPDYNNAFEFIYEFRKNDVISNALENNYNSTFAMFLLKSHYNMIERDKKELNEIRRNESNRDVVLKLSDEVVDAFVGDPNEYEA